MNKNFSKITILIAMSLWGNHLMAGSLTVPNTFAANTPAVAADVNENFTAVVNGVNTNTDAIANIPTPRSLRVVDGGGADIGALVSNHRETLSLFTDEGYFRSYISHATGGNGEYGKTVPIYLSPNCAGQEYTQTANGTVFETLADERRYVPRDGLVITVPGVSFIQGGFGAPITCMEGSYFGTDIYGTPQSGPIWAAYPNDPTVTGIPNGNYAVPLNIEMK